MSALQCQMCDCVSPSITLYVSHLRLVHSKDSSFNLICNIEGCKATFGAFAAYNSHIYRRHRGPLGLSTSTEFEVEPISNIIVSSNKEGFIGDDENFYSNCMATTVNNSEDGTTFPSVLKPLVDPHDSQTDKAAKFLLNLRENRRVSQVTLKDVIETCHTLFTESTSNLKDTIREKLIQENVDVNVIDNVLQQPTESPFEAVSTIYRFEKYCVDHFDCLVS